MKKTIENVKVFVLLVIVISIGATYMYTYTEGTRVYTELTQVGEYQESSVIVPKVHANTVEAIVEPQIESEYVTVSAYSEFDSCHTGESCLMANGDKAHVGAVACPRAIDLGTKVTLDNVEYECKDRTSLAYDGRFDIFTGYGEEGLQKAKDHGIKEMELIYL